MKRISIFVLTVGAVLFDALTASAQGSRPERPYRGLFGGGTDQSAHVVTVNGSTGTGYDTSAALSASEAGLLPPVKPGSGQGGLYNQFGGGLSYSGKLDRVSIGASLSSSARRYPDLDVPTNMSHAASGGLSMALGKNTTLTGTGAVTFQSTRAFTPFAELGDPELGQVPAPSPDYASGHSRYYTFTSNVGFTHQLSRRSSLTASYDRRSNLFANDIEQLSQQTGAFRFSHRLTRDLGLRLGYGRTEARYGVNGRSYQNHNLDTGVDYSRDLSLTRRTKLAFTSGATAVRQDQTNRFDVIGSARLSREIARTWSASVSYNRNVGFLESVLEPTFYDSISTGLGGLISRRISFHSSAGASRGGIGLTRGPNNGFGAWTMNTGISTAMTRNLAMAVNYTFYLYNFEPGAAVITGLPPETNRHSINVTLNAWAPVFQHGKRSHASR